MTLDELLSSVHHNDLMSATKRAFRPLSPLIDITNNPRSALIILVNLTDKQVNNTNLLSKDSCKEKLRDKKWWTRCLQTAQYRHSHNVKYPDIRATGTIRTITNNNLPDYFFSSGKLSPSGWAYAKDSADINRCLFLNAEFTWEQQTTCLAKVLTDSGHPLWKTLRALGCYEKDKQLVTKLLGKISEQVIQVDLRQNYLTQISFPDGKGSYFSLSPVASQSVQSQVFQSLDTHYRYRAITRFDRATNMGLLPASCGGKLRAISTKPFIGNKQHHCLDTKRRWLTKTAIHALRQFTQSNSWLLTDNQKSYTLAKVKDEIRGMVRNWHQAQPQIQAKSPALLVERLNNDLSRTQAATRYAYHPKLTRLFIQSVNILIEANTDSDSTLPECGRYLLIPELKFCGANAASSSVNVGLFSMMSLYGFIHAFERNVRSILSDFKIDSFAICLHQYHIEKRGLTRESSMKSTGEIISPPAIADDWQSDGNLSLLIKSSHTNALPTKIIPGLIPKRLARGSIHLTMDNIKSINSYEDPLDAIRSIKNTVGRWLSFNPNAQLNTVDSLRNSAISRSNQWPTTLGYQFLELPFSKQGALHNYPHAFVEHILGIVQPKTITSPASLDDIFWRYHIEEFGLFVLPRSIK